MRLWVLAVAGVLVIGGALPGFAQQPTGPATLESLLNSDEGQKPATTEADAAPKRPAGTVTRPKDGVNHPDLDKAWADYDAVVTKAAEGIRAAIAKQFDAATAKGDLDAAEKWQNALEKFEKAGELPADKEAKAAVSAAVVDYKKAREELTKAYGTVVKALTVEKRIAEAKAVRRESQAFGKTPEKDTGISKSPVASQRGRRGDADGRVPEGGPSAAKAKSIQPVPEPKALSDEIRTRLPTAEELAVLGNAVNLPSAQVRAAQSAYLERIYAAYGIEKWSAVDIAYLMALHDAFMRVSGHFSVPLPNGNVSGGSNSNLTAFLAQHWILKSRDPRTFVERVRAMGPDARQHFDRFVTEREVKDWLLEVAPPLQTTDAKAKALDAIMQSGILSRGVVDLRRSIQAAIDAGQ